MKNDCTLLLSTYDNGEDCWEGFFKALADCWPAMNMPIVINTEHKQYSFPGYELKTINQKSTDTIPWSKRLLDVLKQIDTEYVLLFLEDFWLDAPVDDEFFQKNLQWMRDNPDVANLSYYPCMPGTNIDDGRFERFERRPQACEYKLNFQVGLWRRKRLIAFLRPHESPWDVEIYGSKRATRYKDGFYSFKEDAPLIFSYGDNMKGCIVHRGKWVKEAVIPMNEKYNLNIDFSIRGFEDFDELLEIDRVYRATKKIDLIRAAWNKPHKFKRIVHRLVHEMDRMVARIKSMI